VYDPISKDVLERPEHYREKTYMHIESAMYTINLLWAFNDNNMLYHLSAEYKKLYELTLKPKTIAKVCDLTLRENFECPICFENKHVINEVIFKSKNKDLCNHSFCKECVNKLFSEQNCKYNCPMCREKIEYILL